LLLGFPSKSLFETSFERYKSDFNTQNAHLKKKKNTYLVKKIKSIFKSPKSLKIATQKNTFDKNLKIKLLSKSSISQMQFQTYSKTLHLNDLL
jgi:hypothetical protein